MHRSWGYRRSFPVPIFRRLLRSPASSCNIIHCESINCQSRLYLESPLAECDVDYRLKKQNAEVHRMLSSGQKGYWLPALPVTTSPNPEQRQSRLIRTSHQPSSRKLKVSDSIEAGYMLRDEVKARHGRLRKRVWLPPVAGPWCDVIAGPGYNKSTQ